MQPLSLPEDILKYKAGEGDSKLQFTWLCDYLAFENSNYTPFWSTRTCCKILGIWKFAQGPKTGHGSSCRASGTL